MARPADLSGLPPVQALKSGAALEAVEGFWAPPGAWAPTLGLARFFEQGSSRLGRHGDRPYEAVVKLEEGERLPLEDGYRLVLEGRFSAFPGADVATCWSESADHRPVCLLGVALDRVAFETAEGGQIAERRD